ncbi:MAG: SAM-dependent methyltransferase [Bacteroidota bacterium]
MAALDAAYWQRRYKEGQTGWDVGGITTPLKEYFDQLVDKEVRVLIPGAGNAYEAAYLHERGFTNVYVLDFAEIPLQNFARKIPSFPSEHLIREDFFSHAATYDLIIEQTFLSAIAPSQRIAYTGKMMDLLEPGGRLVGVLWGVPMRSDAPPYGGSAEIYRELFQGFQQEILEPAYNSIPPRAGAELFIKLRKPLID